MTKKTNSLLFRLGVNSLWTLKTSNFTKIFDTLRMEQSLRSELLKHKWDILSIKWHQLEANVQVYDSFAFSKKTKQKIFRYFVNVKSVKKVSEKFSINYVFLKNFFREVRLFKIKLSSISCVIKTNDIFSLFFELKKLQRISKYLRYLNSFNWVNLDLVLFIIIQLKNNITLFKIDWKLNNHKLRFKLQKINGFLYFKVLSIFIENVLFFFIKNRLKININNIWHNQGWMLKFLFKDTFTLKLLFISCVYNNTEMFSNFVALQLKKNKNHKKVLRKITLIIESFWKGRSVNLRGLQLRVTGKLNGSMRKSKFHYSIGKVQLQTFKTFLNYNISISYTKFGIISTKFWVLHGNKQI